MKIGILGTGAVGSVLYMYLKKAGHSVFGFDTRDGFPPVGKRVLKGLGGISELEIRYEDCSGTETELDFLFVCLKANVIDSQIGRIKNFSSKYIVFTGSYFRNMAFWADSMGEDRALFAFPGFAAVRESDEIEYYYKDDSGKTMLEIEAGTLSGGSPAGFSELEQLFKNTGVRLNGPGAMKSLFMSQSAIRLPLLSSLALAGGSLGSLANRTDLLHLSIKAAREGLYYLKKTGVDVYPSSLNLYRYVPVSIISNIIKKSFASELSRIGIESFGGKALDETLFTLNQLAETVKTEGLPAFNLETLLEAIRLENS